MTTRIGSSPPSAGKALHRAATPAARVSLRADRLLTGRWTGLPIFAAVMAAVFYLTFGPLGSGLSELAGQGVESLAQLLEELLCGWNVNAVLRALLTDGLVRGVGSVVSFLPTIAVLFTLLSILEDSGYLARAAFITDRALGRLGLSGSSFAPLLLGFGCTVPAVMAARTVPGARQPAADRSPAAVCLLQRQAAGADAVRRSVFPPSRACAVSALCGEHRPSGFLPRRS